MTEPNGEMTKPKVGPIDRFFGGSGDNITPGAVLANRNLGFVLAAVAFVALGYGTWPNRLMNVAAACVGLGLGWVLGIVVSPSDQTEESEFSTYTKALSTLFTGYVAGALKDVKLNNIMEYLYRPNIALRVCLAAACALATTAVVFINRRAEVQSLNRRTEGQNGNRRWYIRFDPPTANLPDATPLGLLAKGPYFCEEDAKREMDSLKKTEAYKDVTLTPIAQLEPAAPASS